MTTAWPEVALGDVVQLLAGFAFDAARFSDDGGTPLIRIRDVTRGRTDTFFDGNYDKRYVIVDGEILIGMDGQFNRARWTGGPALLNQRVCKITARGASLDDGYLFHFLPQALKAVEDETPFVTVKHLSMPKLKAIKIPLPPLDEQRRIAAILDKADEVRSKRKAALETLETLSQAIFIEMFGDPVANPKRWPQVEISSLVNSVETWNPKSDLGREFTYIDVSSVDRYSKTVTGATSLECSSAPSRAKQLVRDGDVLVSTVRPNLNGVALITSELNGATASTGFTVLRPKQGVLASQYLFEWVKSPVFIERLMRQATGASYPAVSDRIIKSETLLLPSIDAQLEFTSRMTHVSKFAMTARLQAMAAENLYSSIQQRAFQGTL